MQKCPTHFSHTRSFVHEQMPLSKYIVVYNFLLLVLVPFTFNIILYHNPQFIHSTLTSSAFTTSARLFSESGRRNKSIYALCNMSSSPDTIRTTVH